MGIEKLDLNFTGEDHALCASVSGNDKMRWCFKLFWQRLFGAFHLKHLRLDLCIIVVDSIVAMDGLTTLNLNNVPLLSNELQSIFRSCLNLEWLKLSGCKVLDKLCVSGLERLKFLAVD